MLIIMDVCSRCVLYWSIVSSESVSEIKRCLKDVLKRTGLKPEVLHGDLGKFASGEVRELVEESGIKHSRSERQGSYSNNLIERFNRTLKDIVKDIRSKLMSEGLKGM